MMFADTLISVENIYVNSCEECKLNWKHLRRFFR